MKVLVLEDNQARIKKFKSELIGCNVDYTDNAYEATILCEEVKYDLIFLDHDLGGQEVVSSDDDNTGFQVAKDMKGTINESTFTVIHSANPVGAENMQRELPQAIKVSFIILDIRKCVQLVEDDKK